MLWNQGRQRNKRHGRGEIDELEVRRLQSPAYLFCERDICEINGEIPLPEEASLASLRAIDGSVSGVDGSEMI